MVKDNTTFDPEKHKNDTIRHINFMDRASKETSNHFHGNKSLDAITYLCLLFLKRQFDACNSLKHLLLSYSESNNLAFGCAVIVRALLLDTMFILYFRSKYDLEKDAATPSPEIEILCNDILADGLDQTLKYFETLKRVNVIDDEKLKEEFNKFAKNFARFLHDHTGDGSKPQVRYNGSLKPNKLFNILAQHNDLKAYNGVYDAYQVFSKCDHFGILYQSFAKQPYETQIYQITKAVRVLVDNLSYISVVLRGKFPEDKFLKEQMILVHDYVQKYVASD